MANRYLAVFMSACLSLPAYAGVVLNADTMTATGLPAGQTLPSSPESEEPAPATPFSPKIVTATKMQAWGPVANAGGSDTSTNSSSNSTSAQKPAVRKLERRQRLLKERRNQLKPRRTEP